MKKMVIRYTVILALFSMEITSREMGEMIAPMNPQPGLFWLILSCGARIGILVLTLIQLVRAFTK